MTAGLENSGKGGRKVPSARAALISMIPTAVWFAVGLFYFIANTRGRSREVWAEKQAGTA